MQSCARMYVAHVVYHCTKFLHYMLVSSATSSAAALAAPSRHRPSVVALLRAFFAEGIAALRLMR